MKEPLILTETTDENGVKTVSSNRSIDLADPDDVKALIDADIPEDFVRIMYDAEQMARGHKSNKRVNIGTTRLIATAIAIAIGISLMLILATPYVVYAYLALVVFVVLMMLMGIWR